MRLYYENWPESPRQASPQVARAISDGAAALPALMHLMSVFVCFQGIQK